jgi:hypothetical protein
MFILKQRLSLFELPLDYALSRRHLLLFLELLPVFLSCVWPSFRNFLKNRRRNIFTRIPFQAIYKLFILQKRPFYFLIFLFLDLITDVLRQFQLLGTKDLGHTQAACGRLCEEAQEEVWLSSS